MSRQNTGYERSSLLDVYDYIRRISEVYCRRHENKNNMPTFVIALFPFWRLRYLSKQHEDDADIATRTIVVIFKEEDRKAFKYTSRNPGFDGKTTFQVCLKDVVSTQMPQGSTSM
uniref:MSP domain-containing protein n=1 Tax=Steinernema glaseri TaxID=37863 RepID=A0A1I7YAZ4_9BILA